MIEVSFKNKYIIKTIRILMTNVRWDGIVSNL